jgi:hypothetical protein
MVRHGVILYAIPITARIECDEAEPPGFIFALGVLSGFKRNTMATDDGLWV